LTFVCGSGTSIVIVVTYIARTWLIFTLFIGIALTVDIGVIDKVKRSINKSVTKNSNKNKNLSNQEEESEVIIPLDKDSSSLKQQQEPTAYICYF
jgi:hypothetical protein